MIRAPGLGLSHQELELAHLVAAGCHHRAVVALDPDLRPAEMAAQIVQLLEWRGGREQANTRKTGEMHEISCQGRGLAVMFLILPRRTMRGGRLGPCVTSR